MMANNTWLLAHEECGRASALVNQKKEMEAKVRLLKYTCCLPKYTLPAEVACCSTFFCCLHYMWSTLPPQARELGGTLDPATPHPHPPVCHPPVCRPPACHPPVCHPRRRVILRAAYMTCARL